MRAHVEHASIGVEDVLRSIPVVDIRVDDEDPFYPVLLLRVSRGHRDAVVHAEAHPAVLRGVMPGRAHGTERVLRSAFHHRVDRREDGSTVSYEYAESGSDFVVTATRAHIDAPNGLANETTRTIKTYNDLALLVKREELVYDGTSYQPLYHQTFAYDADRNRTEVRRFDGISGGRITGVLTCTSPGVSSVSSVILSP